MQQENSKTRKYRGNIWVGSMLLVIGGLLLLKQSGYPFPNWLFSWQMLLIVLGLFVGIKNRFRDFSWLILMLIGGFFLLGHLWPDYNVKRYIWPVLIIVLGIIFIFAPKGSGPCRTHRHRRRFRGRHDFRDRGFNRALPQDSPAVAEEETEFVDAPESDLDVVSIFAGVNKKVLSKEFRGGEVVCVFGGAQINLTNADFTSPVEIELVQIFGGTKLVVPANWEIRSETAAIFGGVEDKRPQPSSSVPERVLVLKGVIIFGGIEIISY